MSERFDRAVTGVLTVATLAIAIGVVRQQFVQNANVPAVRQSRYEREWRGFLTVAELLGPPSARVRIVEFTDFQCPFCKAFNSVLDSVRQRYPRDVAVSLVHLPLPGHARALPAARAIECVNKAGKLTDGLDFFFDNQDSLGIRPWTWFARGSGVRDTVAFSRCMSDSTTPPKVRDGIAAATKAGITATPTVFLNGWRYGHPPSADELIRAISNILAGRIPYAGFPREAMTL